MLNKIYISFEQRIIIKLILIITILLLALFFIYKTFNNTSDLTYSEESSTKYKICENNICNNKNLISNIDNTTIKFINNHKIKYNKKIKYNINYKIIANTKITDIKTNAILYEIDEELVHNKGLIGHDNNLNFTNNINVNLSKYNKYVMNYKNNYSSNVKANLDILFYADNNIVSAINIPLSDNSKIVVNDIKHHEKFSDDTWNNYNRKYAYISVILGIICLVLIIKLTKFVTKSFGNKSEYRKELERILKIYDDKIINSKTIYNSKNRDIVKVNSFKEILDVHNNVKKPIIYSKINSVKSEFVVDDEYVLYKYIMKEVDF